MPRGKTAKKTKQVEDYRHEEATRPNNPPAGMAQYDTEKPPKRRFEYDPHLDPQLMWAGKAERLSFEVEAPSIHIHERLSTEAIIRAVQKEQPQPSLFGDENLDRSKTIEFYQHEQGWVNRLILGDSLVVMSSLLEKERLGGRVQMIYIDPPYGISFNSNFQARVSNHTPQERAGETLTREPEQVHAYRDTWTLKEHSYLTYLRDRLLLARDLLTESGSVFVQIGPDRMHLVRVLLDEVLGSNNCVATITLQKTSQVTSKLLPEISDFLLWYARDKERVKYRQLFEDRAETLSGTGQYVNVEIEGARRPMTSEERANPSALPGGARVFAYGDATSQGFSPTKTIDFEFEGQLFHPGANRHWLLRKEGMEGLAKANRLAVRGSGLMFVRYADESSLVRRTNIWTDVGSSFMRDKRYIVQTNPKIIERCILTATDPGDLVLDPTCGSGTTAFAAEKHGRRWAVIDTSRVAVTIARERLLTCAFSFYRLADESRGVDGGLIYARRPWVRASTIGYSQNGEGDEEELEFETLALYDQPEIDRTRLRVSGPFTVEALSRYAVNPMEDDVPPQPDDAQAAEAQGHVTTLLDALRKQGIPRRGGKPTPIDSLKGIANAGWVQAEGTYTDSDGATKTFAVSLGPRFGPVTVAQVDEALHDAYGYDLVVFAGFAATAEAQAYVARGKLGRFNVALLAANPDLLVGDLLKSTPSSQTFRLFSAPEIDLKQDGDEVRVEVVGVDSFDASTGEVVSRSQRDIAAWFLDQDYDGLVFHVSQAFFPRTNGWEALQRALKGTIDPELMEQLESFESLPFKSGKYKKAAVRVVDDSGTTSEAVIDLA